MATQSGNDFIVFGQPKLTDEEIAAVVQTLKSGWLGTGPRTKEFETAFAKYAGATHAIAVSSCTAALQVALEAYGIGPGDEVITTAMTFAATVNAIIDTGATPVLVDVEKGSFNIDLAAAEKVVTARTKAIVPVHFAGAPVDMDQLMAFRKKHGVKVIQDCAHAIETEWNGKRLGAYPDVTCYSFYPTKNITTIEGGMVCSNDQLFIERARLLSNHGLSKDAWKRFSKSGYSHYDVVMPGHKMNMTDVQSSLGLVQLANIDEKYAGRAKLWKTYQQAFRGLDIECPADAKNPNQLHAYHLYTILANDRDALLVELQNRGIGCGVHYRAIPQLTAYREKFGWKPANFPNATRIGDRTLSLPFTPYLTDEQIDRIIATVTDIVSGAGQRKTA